MPEGYVFVPVLVTVAVPPHRQVLPEPPVAPLVEKVSKVAHVDPDTLGAIAALRGKLANHDAVLTWTADDSGPDSEYTIHLPGVREADAANMALKAGIDFATVIPQAHGVVVRIIDKDRYRQNERTAR